MVFHGFFCPSLLSASNWKDFFKFLNQAEIFEPLDLALGKYIQTKFSKINITQVFTAVFISHLVGKNYLHLRLSYWAGKNYPESSTIKLVTFPSLEEWKKELKMADPKLISIASSVSSSGESPMGLMVMDNDAIYLKKYFIYQKDLVKWFVDRNEKSQSNKNKNFLIITGGPGTGKTTQVFQYLINEIVDNPESRIALLAPTGKAAKRLSQAILNNKQQRIKTSKDDTEAKLLKLIPEQATTIHRFLSEQQYLGNSSNLDASIQINEINLFDLVILDEASMISVPLFHVLLPTLRKTKKIILLGDKDQLSSVEEGSLFYDLVTPVTPAGDTVFKSKNNELDLPLIDNIVFLTKNYRYKADSGIGKVANAISTTYPNPEGAFEVLKCITQMNQDAINQDFFYYRHFDLDTIYDLWKSFFLPFFRNWFRLVKELETIQLNSKQNDIINDLNEKSQAIDILKQLFKLQERQVILTAKRKGRFGVDNLNRLSKEWLKVAGYLLANNSINNNNSLQSGVMIIINRNRYDLGLYNGDIGIVLECKTDSTHVSIFFEKKEGEYFFINPEQLSYGDDYEYAFAITIHKSQGSEFEQVMVVMERDKYQQNEHFITREMCYTAITRAKQKVFFLIEKETLEQALIQVGVRHSGIKTELVKNINR